MIAARAAGFTLIETIVALALFALISLAGISLVETTLGIQRRSDGRLDRLADRQRALYTLDADLQQLSDGPRLDDGALTMRRHAAAGDRTVRYALAGDALNRTLDDRTQPLLGGIAAIDWRFHRAGLWSGVPGPPAARPDAIAVTLRLAEGGTLRRVVAVPALP